MDLQTIFAKRRRWDRWGLLLGLVTIAALWLWQDADWSSRLWLAYSSYALIEIVRRQWLWRMLDRKSRELEGIGRSLGLAANPVDDRVYEGIRGTDYVRVSIDEPMILRRAATSNLRVFDGLLFGALFLAAAWLGWAWIPVAATIALAWSWYSTRLFVVVSISREDGTSDRQTLRRLSDVPAAIGSQPLVPVEVDLLPLEPDVDVSGLVDDVRTLDDDNELTSVLRLIGEAGRPETLVPLLTSLRKRSRPISPRAMATAEQAVVKIRKRHHLPEEGTLAISDADEPGRLAVSREAGTLALPSGDPPKR